MVPIPGCPTSSLSRCGSRIHPLRITEHKFIPRETHLLSHPGLLPGSLWTMVLPTLSRLLPNVGVISPPGAPRAALCVLPERGSAHPAAPRNGFFRKVRVPGITLCMFTSRRSTPPPKVPSIPFGTQVKRIRLSSIRKFSRTFTTSPMAGSISANTPSPVRATNTSNSRIGLRMNQLRLPIVSSVWMRFDLYS